jgi:hypothetical protein
MSRRRADFEAHELLEDEYTAACKELDNIDVAKRNFAEFARTHGLKEYTLRRRFKGLTQVCSFYLI